jgi:secreted trypsin-like serine protease
MYPSPKTWRKYNMKLTTQWKNRAGAALIGHHEAPHSRTLRHIALLTLVCLGFGLQSAMAIIGGSPADWSQYPWLAKNVAMFPGQKQWQDRGCSSMIVDQYYAVTAGHCLQGPYPYKVGLMFSDGSVIQVVQEIRDPNYSDDPLNYKFLYGVVSSSVADIGLQRLAQPVGSSKARQVFDIFLSVVYAGVQPNLTGVTGKVLGWGSTQQSQFFLSPPAAFSPALQQIDEVVETNASCQAVLNGFAELISGGLLTEAPFQFNNSLFCAQPVGFTPVTPPQVPTVFEGVCNGDSGPLFIDIFDRPVVLGFVTDELATSLETPCGNGLDIYTKLTPAYVDWMDSVIHGQL